MTGGFSMNKQFKRFLAFFLSLAIVLCTSGSFQSFAADKSAAAAAEDGDTFETAREVTGSFKAVIKKTSSFYKFTAAQNGFYRISGDLPDKGVYLEVYDSEKSYMHYEDGSFWKEGLETGFDDFIVLDEGSTYYFKISLFYGNSAPVLPISFDVDIEYLGVITEALPVSLPDKLVYIKDIDENKYSGPDFQYYEFRFDITGAVCSVEFSQGQSVELRGIEIEYALTKSYNNERRQLGENTVYFKFGETTAFSFVITLIENPVESIEVVRLPDKTNYTYGIDGTLSADGCFSPAADMTGLQIKVSYTDGTHKIFDWESCCGGWTYASDTSIIEGYMANAYCHMVCDPCETSVELDYLTKTTDFKINISAPKFSEKISILFSAIRLSFAENIFVFYYLPLILFSIPTNFFNMLFKLIKM